MIKQLGKHDTLMSPFLTVKGWSLHNTEPLDLVLTETTGSEEPVALEFMDYSFGDGTGSLNRDCNIALEHQPTDLAIPEEGYSGSGKFFPDSEPINSKTGTFQRLIHDQIYRAFYNRYNNPLQIFGIDNIDFPLSQNNRYLADDFLMFTIPRMIFGERIQENTVTLFDTHFDDNIIINDDGDGNLVVKSNLFSKIQEVRAFGNYYFTGSVLVCGVTGSSPSGSMTLIVTSGSAILDWTDPFDNEDGFIVQKSLDGLVYNSYATTSADVSYYVDNNVTASNTYWYRIYAFNQWGTSSFSNTASIDFTAAPTSSCPLLFEAVKFSGCISSSDYSVYQNTYGTWLPITNSVESSSISIYARSQDFYVALTLTDQSGSDIARNQDGGYNFANDVGNAAITYTLNETGYYGLEIASADNAVGAFEVTVSPGYQQGPIWSGYTPYDTLYISSSNMIAVADTGTKIVFINPMTNAVVTEHTFPLLYSAVYSSVQDRVYGWTMDATFSDNLIVEFDNTGSILAYYTASLVNFDGYLFYDYDKDRLVLQSQNASRKVTIWDIATKTTVTSCSVAGLTGASLSWGTYSGVDQAYYCPVDTLGNVNAPMVRIDANTFSASLTVATARDYIQFIPETGLIAAPSLRFIDPLLDALAGTGSFSGGTFEDAVYDPCTDCTVLVYDNNGGTGTNAIFVDSAFQIKNVVNLGTASLHPDSNSLYGYSVGYNASSSQLLVGLSDFSSATLRSIQLSVPSQTFVFNQTGSFPERLAAPTDFSAFDFGGQAFVAWTDNSPNELGFALSKSLDGVNFVPEAILPVDTSFYQDFAVSSGNTYWYSLYAFNANMTSSAIPFTCSVFIA